MTERIFVRDPQGKLEALEEDSFLNEAELQELLAECPALLDGAQMQPDAPRRWLLLAREQGISETAGEGGRWSVDHLLVDQDAVPTLVEVKLGGNPEIRRTVVGQMLEYAAHAAQTWDARQLRQTFEESTKRQGLSPQAVLRDLLQSESEPDADSFWQKVAENLAECRLRLLFVGDDIPSPLTRVAEFLNRQMSGMEVFAVEIRQFRSESVQILVPRVFGGSSLPASRQRMNRAEFLSYFQSDETRAAATRLLDAGGKLGVLDWVKNGVIIKASCPRHWLTIPVAWLWPPSKPGGRYRTREFSFGQETTTYYPDLDEEVRTVLQQWPDQFQADSFTEDASSKGLTAWSVGYDDAARHIDLLEERLSGVLTELASLEVEPEVSE